MGLIISRFRRKKTTIEILEGIEKEINGLQKNRKDNQDRQKCVATGLIIYSIILYILLAIVIFLLYFPDTWPLRLLYSLPLLAFPFLIWGVKKLLHWYFVKRIAGNDLALRDLREKKKQILEDVMETETYKKAKDILEKFDPARYKKLEKDEQTSHVSPALSPGISSSGLHQRKNVVSQPPTPMLGTPAMRMSMPRPMPSSSAVIRPTTSNPFGNTPLRAPRPAGQLSATPMGRGRGGPGGGGPIQQQQQQRMMQSQAMPPQMARPYGPPGPPMPRTVLPRDRGMMDRMMDYLVGDGPENRYALICRACHSHNGMALMEEFEYMGFRCCYCFVMNPARKQRPLAPRLEFFTPNSKGKAVTLTKPEESEEESDSSQDEDEEENAKKDGNDKRNNENSSNGNGDNKNTKVIQSSATTSSSSSSSTTSSPSSLSASALHAPTSSSQNRNVPSRSKLPVTGGAVNIHSNPKQPSGPGGPKSNVPSSGLPRFQGRVASAPSSSVPGSGQSQKGLVHPSQSALGDDISKNVIATASLEASSRLSNAAKGDFTHFAASKQEVEKDDTGEGPSSSLGENVDDDTTDGATNINENCSTSNAEQGEGITDDLLHSTIHSTLAATTTTATTQITTQVEEGETSEQRDGGDFGGNVPATGGDSAGAEPFQTGDFDEDYEMITGADGEEEGGGGGVLSSDLDGKTGSSEIVKQEEDDGSARSC